MAAETMRSTLQELHTLSQWCIMSSTSCMRERGGEGRGEKEERGRGGRGGGGERGGGEVNVTDTISIDSILSCHDRAEMYTE